MCRSKRTTRDGKTLRRHKGCDEGRPTVWSGRDQWTMSMPMLSLYRGALWVCTFKVDGPERDKRLATICDWLMGRRRAPPGATGRVFLETRREEGGLSLGSRPWLHRHWGIPRCALPGDWLAGCVCVYVCACLSVLSCLSNKAGRQARRKYPRATRFVLRGERRPDSRKKDWDLT